MALMQKKIVAFVVAFALCDLAYIGWKTIYAAPATPAAAKASESAAQATVQLEFKVPSMTCANCALKLRKALENQPYVAGLNFFPSKKLMQVELKPQYAAAAQREQTIQSIKDSTSGQGFAVELL